MTSGGDSQGMNASVRAVVKTALHKGVDVYAILNGYQGMVNGGDMIRKMDWESVGGILHKGGTVIGTARCAEFREREGRLKAAKNLIDNQIDNLVVIGGDGSLTGANFFKEEWTSILEELIERKWITKQQADKHPKLNIVGLVGSIDNDLSGTDMTIGADTALRRITDALDAISSTAASHQRTFVVEVMGRNCGYLALMAAIASGADYLLIPERPPESDDWAEDLCQTIQSHKQLGKRKSLIIVAEGAIDKNGKPIKSFEVVEVLKERINEEARLTILGHVQRGGAPTAFDRYMSTLLGYAAVEHLLNDVPDKESMIIGLQKNKVKAVPLMESIKQTKSIANFIADKDYDKAIELRGGSFRETLEAFKTLRQAMPKPVPEGHKQLNLLIMNASGLAPGMNTAVRTAVRLGLDRGHRILGVHNAVEGLINNEITEMSWTEVEEWTNQGGSMLGTNRKTLKKKDFYRVARNLEEHKIDGMLMIGGYLGYECFYSLIKKRSEFQAFDIPMVCLPASINNNLPGTDMSVGADSALNNIVDAVDKIKESAVANKRAFIVEVMGRYCGYLSTMSGLATGAERVYIHEEGVTLKDIMKDVKMFVDGFKAGKRLGLVLKSEYANKIYTTPIVAALYEEDGGDVFDVRQAILGHLQQGGNPSSYDRGIATRLAASSIDFLINAAENTKNDAVNIGMQGGDVIYTDLEDWPKLIDPEYNRPVNQWWLSLNPLIDLFGRYKP